MNTSSSEGSGQPESPRGDEHADGGPVEKDRPDRTETDAAERIVELEARVEALEDERRHLEAVLDVIPVGVWIADARGRLVARNEAAADIWDRETVLSERTKDYEADYPAWRLDGTRVGSEEWGLARAIHRGETSRAEELEIETASGERKRILNYAAPIVGDDGAVQGAVAVNVDITARREAEARGVKQEQVLRSVAQGVVVTDNQGRVTHWNPAAEELFGWPREAVLGRAIMEITVPEDARDRASEAMGRVMDGGRWVGEMDLRRRDGTTFPGRISLSSITDPEGRFAGVVGITTDLTEWNEARARREELIQALEHERSRLEEIFHGAPAFMAVLRGPEHTFEMANPLYLRLIGGREVEGLPFREAIPEAVDQGIVQILDRVRETGAPYHGDEEPLELVDDETGETRTVYFSYVYQPLRSLDGEVSRIVVHGVDVTDLVEARHRAEAASRAKSDFVAAMSHELRTPLNAIIGYADLLDAGVPAAVPEEARSQVRRIALSARHLQQIIEDVLRVGRLEAGREGLEPVPVDLSEVVEEVRVIMEPLTLEKGLEMRLPDRVDASLISDPGKIRQILVNLVGNAVKFTSEGFVELRVERVDDGAVRLVVSDSGIGLTADEKDRLFEPFWQARREERRTEGVGLGLAITRRLVGMLDGRVEVESAPGAGSTFTVTLPTLAGER